MRTFIALLLSLGASQLSPGAETLRITPVRSFPDYERIALAVTPRSGPHVHGVFAIGDVNKDGRADVVMYELDGPDPDFPRGAEPVNYLATVYLGNGQGGFARQPETSVVLPIANHIGDFLLADFNGDQSLDLLVTDQGVDLLLSLGRGDGTFQQAKNLALNALAFPVVADLNADGRVDIVAATAEGAAMVFLGRGDGTFTPGVTLDTVTNSVGQRRGQIMISDVNKDSKLDIVVASILDDTPPYLGNLDVFLGRGDGTFADAIRNANFPVWRGAVGDLNADGIVDYIGIRYAPEAVEVWLGTGEGNFRRRTSYSLSGYLPGLVALGDLNSDGMLDMVSGLITTDSKPAPFGIFLGKGDGTFQARRLHRSIGNDGHDSTVPKLVDVNGDGALDMLAVAVSRDVVTNTFAVNLNRGSQLSSTLGYQVTVQNTTARSIVLEGSTDLQTWTPITTNKPAGDWSVIDSASGFPQRFYRTRQP